MAQQAANGEEPRVFVILTDNQGQVAESLKMQAQIPPQKQQGLADLNQQSRPNNQTENNLYDKRV